MLADDHPLVVAGLCALLAGRDEIEVVGTASDGAEATALCLAEAPDVLLMDLAMPGMDGIEATRRISAAGVGTRVVVLSAFAQRERIESALEAGAVGFVAKDEDPEELFARIRGAGAGSPASAGTSSR